MEEKTNKMEIIETKEGKKVEIAPDVLLDCISDIDILVSSHVAMLRAVSNILHRLVDSGIPHNDAASVALELQRRAAAKANAMTSMEKDEKEDVSHGDPAEEDRAETDQAET